MDKKTLIAIAAGIATGTLAVLAYVVIADSGPAHVRIDPADEDLVMRGKELYANNCASCHGAKLEGQPNWRKRLPNGRLPAPPHDETGHTWHHPDAQLIDIVKNGLVPGRTAPEGYESDMPAYGSSLNDADIIAVLAYIKSTWSREALEAQTSLTRQYEQAQEQAQRVAN